MQDFWSQAQEILSKYDLLCHPFYQAWSEGKLTRDDLARYAADYYHHVAAFPEYLETVAARNEGELQRAVESNRRDELGEDSADGRTHADLWLDFAAAMGAARRASAEPPAEIEALVDSFRRIAREGSPVEALAAFYAYESQVPRVAAEKARGLRAWYGADDPACRYFDLHTTADVHHSNVWRQAIDRQLAQGASPSAALYALSNAARALWTALDGIERERLARAA